MLPPEKGDERVAGDGSLWVMERLSAPDQREKHPLL